jgi:hypothetical protein
MEGRMLVVIHLFAEAINLHLVFFHGAAYLFDEGPLKVRAFRQGDGKASLNPCRPRLGGVPRMALF